VIFSKEGVIIKELKRNGYGRKAEDNLQLGIYVLGYYTSTKVMPIRAELECITTGSKSSHTITTDYLQQIHTRILETVYSIQKGKFQAKPSKSVCQTCDWRLQCPV